MKIITTEFTEKHVSSVAREVGYAGQSSKNRDLQ